MNPPSEEHELPRAARRGEPPADGADVRGAPNGDDQLSTLRSLLIGPERDRIETVERELADKERLARTVSEVLPQAIVERGRSDARLQRALTPTIEDAIQESVRRNPKALADAIFPVLGPAIRKAITHTFASLVETINQTFEHAFSVQSLKWRLQAWRTGRPFSEIVIANSLVYRVEHVLLIHRETGIGLHDVVAPGLEAKDPDLVSAMITGIQDFVRDSFSADKTDSLDQARVGKYVLVVERGPRALLCAAVLGVPTAEVRPRLQEALETIHAEKNTALVEFDGDTTPFETTHMELESCLLEQRREKPEKKGGVGRILLGTAALAVVIACTVWWIVSWRRAQHWDDYVARLAAEPGIVVVSTGEQDGQRLVTGFRDPMAEDPARILQDMGLSPERVRHDWEPYLSAHPPFVTTRARRLLSPPPTVALEVRGDRLRFTGRASADWIREASRLAELLPSIVRLETAELELVGSADLTAQEAVVERLEIEFDPASSYLNEAASSQVGEVSRSLAQLDQMAQAADRSVTVHLIGSGDWGAGAADARLGRARASSVRTALIRGEWSVTTFHIEARAETMPGDHDAAGRVVLDARIRREETNR